MRVTNRTLTIVLIAAAALAAVGAGAGSAADKPTAEQARIAAVTRPTTDFSKAEPFEARPGGAATVFTEINRDIFSQSSANMSFERELDFKVGNGIFRKVWVSSPSSTVSSDGLGPFYNARACQLCHVKDGRGRTPAADEDGVSLFLRLSVPPATEAERAALASHQRNVIPEPTYGGQLQNYSVQGLKAEGRMTLRYEERPVTLADGTVVSLRKPVYGVADLAYGPMHPDTMISPRIAPPMIGAGLLEAIPEADLLAASDPDDRDGDGISGRPNLVWSDEHGEVRIGRFGWKAGTPTVAQQSSDAFRGDMGLSTPLYRDPAGDCSARQADCRSAPHGEDPVEGSEVTASMMDALVFYSRNLGVPARRDVDDPAVLAGKQLFYEAGCIACHRPKFVTRRDSIGPEQSFQLIWPYSDLLLHDMGEGLADNRPEGVASGREWKTPPLWGLGLTRTVNDREELLHDGRARGPLEAILWHGGEAEASKDRVVAMTREERDALLAFLATL
ncbi:di-heme oxidoreductase family protein [Oceanibacterium hippocampi]|uniref:Cytochrome c n=1 Tax=Oceanibacterium hippocampi TaxID=745714 RepID=A0A1Y5TXN0_9PROT|nr:di-heme oxidoredictase family protein [Oceanibacterium hippocampi]SLN75883.1 Cytochrome c [Oceanibacterium hippocampi]